MKSKVKVDNMCFFYSLFLNVFSEGAYWMFGGIVFHITGPK